MPVRKCRAMSSLVGFVLMARAVPTALGQAGSPPPTLDVPPTLDPPPTLGAPPPPPPTANLPTRAEKPFHVDLTVYGWLTSLTGYQTVYGTTVLTDSSFAEVMKESDQVAAFSGRVDLRWRRFGLFVDGMYTRLGVDNVPSDGGPIDLVSEMTFVDFGLSYRALEWDVGGGRSAALSVYIGARWAHTGLELDPDLSGSVESTHDWVEPIVGAGVSLGLTPTVHVDAKADIGGFGVGSDLTWSATAVLGFDTRLGDRPLTLFAGYRALGEDYDGRSSFGFDTILHGPVLGATVWF